MRLTLFALIGMLTIQCLPAQEAVAGQDSSVTNDTAAYAPLLLFTSGMGKIVPFEDGQMLEVGRDYTLAAVAAPGFTFTNWMPVNVFTLVEYFYDPVTGLTNTVTSTDISPVPDFTSQPALKFTMQPVQVIFDIPGRSTLTEARGWQANFITKPLHAP